MLPVESAHYVLERSREREKERRSLGLGGKSVQLLQWMISFMMSMSCEIGGGTIPRPGIMGFIGAIPVIMPRLGSKSAGTSKRTE